MINRGILFVGLGLFSLSLCMTAEGEEFDLNALIPDMTLGSDPGGQDSVYIICGGQTSTSLTLEVWVKTDNADPSDALTAVFIPIEINADQPGVTLDTTVTTVYAGSPIQSWEYIAVGVASAGGDPSVFPMQLVVGGVDFDESATLGVGNHLIAKLNFAVSQPTNICVTGTFWFMSNSLLLVTAQKNGYTPAFVGACCGPIVPSLSEWGLILFGITLLIGLVWYVRKRRVAARV